MFFELLEANHIRSVLPSNMNERNYILLLNSLAFESENYFEIILK